MVKVKSSRGGFVNVEILGINEIKRLVLAGKKQIHLGADFGVIRAGTLIQQEVKESVIGNRAEMKSVDTGRFANSIEFKKLGDAQGIVKPKKVSYPNSTQTTEDVANIMEFGANIIGGPRLHFSHTKTRNEKKADEIVENEIQAQLKRNRAFVKGVLRPGMKFGKFFK